MEIKELELEEDITADYDDSSENKELEAQIDLEIEKIKQDKRMYFNEPEFKKYLKLYQEGLVYDNEDPLAPPVSTNKKAESYITKSVMEVINRIISIYKYTNWEEREDLRQHAFMNCFGNFRKFDPSKGSCFNYYSIIAKRCLLNYTLRRAKHRGHSDIEEQLELETNEHFDSSQFLTDLENLLYKIVDENFVGKRRKRYYQIICVIIEYLRTTVVFVGKTDLYSYARAYGVKNTEIREFINSINKREDVSRHWGNYSWL